MLKPKINYDIQQGSDEWFAAKVGKPSASNASRLVTSTGQPSKSMIGYAQELGAEMFAGKSLNEWAGNAATEFGKNTEEEARLAYSMLADYEVIQCAFIEDGLQQCIISPDGLISDPENGDGLLEIKCKPKHHLTTLLYYKKNGRIPPDYIAQTQFQLLISERAWCDLYYYSKELPCLCVRQYPDPKIFDALTQQLLAVIAERNLIYKQLKEF